MTYRARATVWGLVLVLLATSTALAEWPMARHDARRSGFVDGTAPIATPQPAWTTFLGGKLQWHQWIPGAFVSVTGTLSVVALIGGNLESRRIDDGLLWSTSLYALDNLCGRYDLDGDGSKEIVASGRGPEGAFSAFVFDSLTGQQLWRTAPGLIGHIDDSVRIVDVDGDGIVDLFAVNANPTEPGATPKKGFVFTFASGYDAAVQLSSLDTAAPRDYPVDYYDAVLDMNGDLSPDLFVMGRDNVYLYDLATGVLHGATDDDAGKTSAGRAKTRVTDVDGDGDDEVLIFPSGGWSATYNSVRVAMFDWDHLAARPVLVWERAAADFDTDQMAHADTSIAAVTGLQEQVVVAFRHAPAPDFLLEVLDTATGALVTSVADARPLATHDVNGDGMAEIFIERLDGTRAVLTHDGAGGLMVMHELGATMNVALCAQRDQAGYHVAKRRAVCTGFGGIILTESPTEGSSLHVADLSGASIDTMAAIASPPNTTFMATHVGSYPDLEEYATLSAVTSAGRLFVYSPTSYAPLNYQPDGDQPVLGMRVRSNEPGYGDLTGFPVAADVDGDGGEEVLVITSSGELVVHTFKSGAGPTPLWTTQDVGRVVVARDDDGVPVIVAMDHKVMRAFDGAGDLLWTNDMTGGGTNILYGDVVTADILGAAGDEIAFQTRGSDGAQRLVVYSADGGLVFDVVADVNNLGMRRLAVANLGGPGGPPSIIGGTAVSMWRFNATDGASTVLTPTEISVHSVISDPAGDGFDRVFLASRNHFEFYDPAVGMVYTNAVPQNQPVLGAKVSCAGEDTYVAAKAYTGTVVATTMGTGATLWTMAYANGVAYANEAAANAAGATPGALANVAAIGHLPDAGSGPSALVGSADGSVYALDACGGDIHWSYALGAGVREVVVADTDGDGAFEVVAATADGQLSGLAEATILGPTGVIDIDPPSGIVDVDVDDIESSDTLYVKWDAEAGATYEVMARTVDGAVVSGGFQPASSPGNQALSGLPLVVGLRYEVGVRAQDGSGETSPVTWSDGVTVIDATSPEATLVADPSVIPIGVGVSALTWTADDLIGLATVSLVVEDPSEAVVATLVTLNLTASMSEGGQETWLARTDALEPVPSGDYTARLTVTDHGGSTAEATALITVHDPGAETQGEAQPEQSLEPLPEAPPEVMLEQGPEASPEPAPDLLATDDVNPDVAPDTGPIAGRPAGCDCQSGGSHLPDPGALALLALLALLLARISH